MENKSDLLTVEHSQGTGRLSSVQIEPQTLEVDGLSLRSLCPITQSQPGKTAGVAGYAMPEVRVHDYAGSDQAGGF